MNNPIPRIDPEFKELMPPLSPEEYNQLEQNILAHRKCRDAVVVWGDILVDGYNRLRICATHSIPFEIKQVHFDSREEAMLWILDNQLGRRNLTDAMRIELALSKAELLRQRARQNQIRGGARGGSSRPSDKPDATHPEPAIPVADEANILPECPNDTDCKLFSLSSKPEKEPINVHKAVANEAGVSDGTLHHYMQIAEHGTPELLESVKSGELKIGTAHRLPDKEITTQDINERLLGLLEKIKHVKDAYDAQPTD